jgi:D-alanyl-D-alanine carboxypeptidase
MTPWWVRRWRPTLVALLVVAAVGVGTAPVPPPEEAAAAGPSLPRPAEVAGGAPGPVALPAVRARAFVLADEETGQVLLERSSSRPRPMASTTKVMTALLTLERLPQRRVVAIGPGPVAVGGESLRLRVGERLTVRQLLLALMLKSANDAAAALAEAVDGSQAAFARRMNRRAAALGLRATRFVTPHGLDRPGHHTSARDLARLWEVAMRRADFRALVATRRAAIPGGGLLRRFPNRNQLLFTYRWTEGGKTGFTSQARRCLVASASRGGRRLVAVALGSLDAFTDVHALFEYGFNALVRVRLSARDGTATVRGGGRAERWQVTASVDALVRRDLLGRVVAVPAPAPAPGGGGPGSTAPGPGGSPPVWLAAGGRLLAPLPVRRLGSAPPDGGAGAGFRPGPVPAGTTAAVIDPFLAQAAA